MLLRLLEQNKDIFLPMTINAINSPVIENVKKETAHMPSLQPVGSKLSPGA